MRKIPGSKEFFQRRDKKKTKSHDIIDMRAKTPDTQIVARKNDGDIQAVLIHQKGRNRLLNVL
jgi:hypothetical protein